MLVGRKGQQPFYVEEELRCEWITGVASLQDSPQTPTPLTDPTESSIYQQDTHLHPYSLPSLHK